MNFEFATATRIVFGGGKRSELFAVAPSFGSRALLVTGGNQSRTEWASQGLRQKGVAAEIFSIPTEPTIALAEKGREIARAANCQFVIGVGGGSVLDAAKAIAALATNEEAALEYLEVIGRAKPLSNPPLPLIGIPTTAGTGAEVTRNAVLLSPEHQLKVSLRSPRMLPTLAIVDPELTYDLPPHLTASTGMDALTQLIEAFVCNRANPIIDGLCREAIPRVARALRLAFREPGNKAARADMALASLFGGIALANAGLGAVHGFAAPIGGMFPAPHGAICAALLPAALEVNDRALRQRAPGSSSQERFAELGKLLIGRMDGAAKEAIAFVRALADELKIPPLGAWGIDPSHVEVLCSRALQASSMKANPIVLTNAELREILRLSL
jgi:alcohol dehydrogenase class IV